MLAHSDSTTNELAGAALVRTKDARCNWEICRRMMILLIVYLCFEWRKQTEVRSRFRARLAFQWKLECAQYRVYAHLGATRLYLYEVRYSRNCELADGSARLGKNLYNVAVRKSAGLRHP